MKPQTSSTDVQATAAAAQAVGRTCLSAFATPSRFIRPLCTAAIDESRPLLNEPATPSRFRTPPCAASAPQRRRSAAFGPPWFCTPRRWGCAGPSGPRTQVEALAGSQGEAEDKGPRRACMPASGAGSWNRPSGARPRTKVREGASTGKGAQCPAGAEGCIHPPSMRRTGASVAASLSRTAHRRRSACALPGARGEDVACTIRGGRPVAPVRSINGACCWPCAAHPVPHRPLRAGGSPNRRRGASMQSINAPAPDDTKGSSSR
jgi:hypothetical protein